MTDEREPIGNSLYPTPKKGSLSEDNEAYLHPTQAKGPKMGNTPRKLFIFGILFFIILLISLAILAGYASYF